MSCLYRHIGSLVHMHCMWLELFFLHISNQKPIACVPHLAQGVNE